MHQAAADQMLNPSLYTLHQFHEHVFRSITLLQQHRAPFSPIHLCTGCCQESLHCSLTHLFSASLPPTRRSALDAGTRSRSSLAVVSVVTLGSITRRTKLSLHNTASWDSHHFWSPRIHPPLPNSTVISFWEITCPRLHLVI